MTSEKPGLQFSMAGFDPRSDAEWLLETIVDDFAQSMAVPHRAEFYAHLADLIAQRRHGEERTAADTKADPGLPPRVQ